jgi:shikimate kinase
MMGSGISYGAISVINSIPCGIGSTIGIDLKTVSEFTPGGTGKNVRILNDPSEDDTMAKLCVEAALNCMGVELKGWTLSVNSEIPISRGLKSSSSACNSIISAVLDEYGQKMKPLDMIKMGVECARSAGVTVTGAFDDACGCHLGGLVVTDNSRDELLAHYDIKDYDVVIHVPERRIRKHSLSKEMFAPVSERAAELVKLLPEGLLEAMTENGSLISGIVGENGVMAKVAMRRGALAAGISGTGPATAMLIEKGKGKGLADDIGDCIFTTTRRKVND